MPTDDQVKQVCATVARLVRPAHCGKTMETARAVAAQFGVAQTEAQKDLADAAPCDCGLTQD